MPTPIPNANLNPNLDFDLNFNLNADRILAPLLLFPSSLELLPLVPQNLPSFQALPALPTLLALDLPSPLLRAKLASLIESSDRRAPTSDAEADVSRGGRGFDQERAGRAVLYIVSARAQIIPGTTHDALHLHLVGVEDLGVAAAIRLLFVGVWVAGNPLCALSGRCGRDGLFGATRRVGLVVMAVGLGLLSVHGVHLYWTM